MSENPTSYSVEPWLRVKSRSFRSRLILGIEQYTSAPLVGRVLEAGGCDVFITTVDLEQTRASLLISDLDDAAGLDRFIWIGTTSFARSKEDAIRTAQVLRGSFGIDIMKLDVRPADNVPDNQQTIEAARLLLDEEFAVLPFIRPDAETAATLERIGCCAIRVQAAPVASGLGLVDRRALREVIDAVSIPVVIEGGLGLPSHVAEAMELGADAVLVNTAVAQAADPVGMAAAMRLAVLAGRAAAPRVAVAGAATASPA